MFVSFLTDDNAPSYARVSVTFEVIAAIIFGAIAVVIFVTLCCACSDMWIGILGIICGGIACELHLSPLHSVQGLLENQTISILLRNLFSSESDIVLSCLNSVIFFTVTLI